MSNNINIDVGMRRSLAKFSGLCGALLAMPVIYVKHPDMWLAGGIFGLVFGWALGMINQGFAAIIILAAGCYWANELGLLHR